MDFGVVKEHAIKICKSWNEHFICPMESDVLDIDTSEECSIKITCEDGAVFVFPKSDCLCLPIIHSTAEELAIVFTDRLIESLTLEYLAQRQVSEMIVTVGETINQQAIYKIQLKDYSSNLAESLIKAQPSPCLPSS
mmetsp:Transcript_4916/g.9259  ORF Transcript_4916/g.9259 Transcript_4916/m.9259 type:complete len:137 (-) Transcript_4916:30-440(-)